MNWKKAFYMAYIKFIMCKKISVTQVLLALDNWFERQMINEHEWKMLRKFTALTRGVFY